MDNTFIEKRIKAYIDDNVFKNALLIDGKWGSGKTHFIKEYFNNNCQDNPIYVDLDGKSNIDEIHKLINLSLVTKNNIPSDFSNGLINLSDIHLTAKLIGINFNIKDTIENIANVIGKKKITDENYLLIFDNIEKCECKLNDVLNLITDFIKSAAKVIVLANQEDFVSENKVIFQSFVDKYVGFTIRYTSNYQVTITELINNESLPLKKHLTNIKDKMFLLVNSFKKYDVKTFVFFLEKAKIIIKNIDKKYENYLDNILLYCFYSCVYYIDANGVYDWNKDCLFSHVVFTPNEINKDMNNKIDCDCFKFVDELISSGTVNLDLINKTMVKYSEYEKYLKDDEAYRVLDKWWIKDIESIKNAYSSLIDNLKKDIYHLCLYPKIIDNLSSLYSIKVFNKKDLNLVEKTMIKNIQNGRKDVVYNWNIPSNDAIGILQTAISSMSKIKNSLYIENNKEEYSFIQNALKEKRWAYSIYNHYKDLQSPINFFKLVDEKRLLNNIENVTSENMNYFYRIVNLYCYEFETNGIDVIQKEKLEHVVDTLNKVKKEETRDQIILYNIDIVINEILNILNLK